MRRNAGTTSSTREQPRGREHWNAFSALKNERATAHFLKRVRRKDCIHSRRKLVRAAAAAAAASAAAAAAAASAAAAVAAAVAAAEAKAEAEAQAEVEAEA